MLLVTGSTGHLGANLVRRLLDDGQRVRVLVRQQNDLTALDGLDVEKAYGDLRDLAACRNAVAGCQRIHHCAALVSTLAGNRKHRRDIFECNVLGTRNLLRAAREADVERVVVTGSLSAVGHTPDRPCNEDDLFNPFEPNLPYGFSKALVEHECWKAVAEGLPVVVAVSCAILGPNDFKPSRMGRTLVDFANRRLRAYVPGGFEFVSARDMVQGHLLAMDRGRPGQRYIFSTQFLTVDELLGIFEQVTGQRRPRLRLPGPLMSGIAAVVDQALRFFPAVPRRFTPGAVRLLRMQRRADCSRAKSELGYQPTSIADAVREAHAFFVTRGLIMDSLTAGTVPVPKSAAASAAARKI
ncbi:MAG: NAD-dependent epimerase/dehydratase family protein [Planctomycetes bacterium]|nr:NAD-dependent epimerase/dehydratase family protein [Planctomycetota bacterium]